MKKILDLESFNAKVELLETSAIAGYWTRTPRWKYTESVIAELKKINPDTALELGTAKISLMNFSDSMDIDEALMDDDNIKNKRYVIDSRITPWNIGDKQYDVFVGLQVLEHLEPNQLDVFREIKRVSKYAIISLPYMWNCPKNISHHMITDEKIKSWTDNEIPYKQEIIERRIILYYNFK